MAKQRELVIPEALDGARADKAVAELLRVSRAEARRLVDSGVLVDGFPVRPSDRVAAGATVVTPPIAEPAALSAEEVQFEVLHEDDDVIVVEKPPGVVVHPGSGRTTGTLAAGLIHRYPEIEGVGQSGRWGLVHRLDRDTSGVLVVARNQAAHDALTAMVRSRRIARVYIALVHGLAGSPTGTIEAPIGRDPGSPTRRAVHPEGKPARTHYRVLDLYPDRDCTLVEVTLETGRTHQIRVHFAAIGHPVVGDATYERRRHRLGASRTFLHASRVEFAHPVTGEVISVTSTLPRDLQAVLDGLGRGTGPIPIALGR